MPSILGHSIIGVTAAQISGEKLNRKKLLALCLICSLVSDADILTFALNIPYGSVWGHRGFLHSICFSVIAGWIATAFFLKTASLKTRRSWRWLCYFSMITLSHALLDAMTTGGHGVALFSPFNSHRYFFNYRTIYVSPLFLSRFASFAGTRILLKELLCIFIPCLAVVWIKTKLVDRLERKIQFLLTIALSLGLLLSFWIFHIILIREELVPGINRIDVHEISAEILKNREHGIAELPVNDLPEKKLIVNYHELINRNLINTLLKPQTPPWTSSSFPLWLGGAAGQWQEPLLLQALKSILGETFPRKSELLALLHQSETTSPQSPKARSELLKLAPTVKYDLAVGDYYLSTTRTESIMRGRGSLDTFPDAPFWSGYCTSIGLAAIYEPEPQNPVRLLNPDGYEITLLPHDINALLGIAYQFMSPSHWQLGNRCDLDGPASESCVDVNPAVLVIALTNRLGLAKTTFLIDKEPFIKLQTAAIRSAEVKEINPPYFVNERSSFFNVDTRVIQWLVDIEIKLNVTKIDSFSTPSSETQKEEQLFYRATLGLDSNLNLVGGRWEDPFNHPDFAWGGYSALTQPALIDRQTKANLIEWPILKKIVEISAQTQPQKETLQISSIQQDIIYHGLSIQSPESGIFGRIAYFNASNPIELYGSLEGKGVMKIKSLTLVELKRAKNDWQEIKIVSEDLLIEPQMKRIFFHLKTQGTLENRGIILLRLDPNEILSADKINRFRLPIQKKFERLAD